MIIIKNQGVKRSQNLWLFIPRRPDGRVNGKIENLDLNFYRPTPVDFFCHLLHPREYLYECG